MMDLSIKNECKDLMEQGIAELRLNLNEIQLNKLMAYLELLIKWNAVYNLTSVRDPIEMVKQHLLDSLAAAFAFAESKNCLDVGSGGGLPGIVLAIVYPEKRWTLIDTVNKKTAFLKQVKAELGLKNVTVLTGRVEKLGQQELFDVITSRAFSELVNFVNWAGHLLAPEGKMIALKGQMPLSELESLPSEWILEDSKPISVPGLDVQRHILWLVKNK